MEKKYNIWRREKCRNTQRKIHEALTDVDGIAIPLDASGMKRIGDCSQL